MRFLERRSFQEFLTARVFHDDKKNVGGDCLPAAKAQCLHRVGERGTLRLREDGDGSKRQSDTTGEFGGSCDATTYSK
jgi:hypothetical protein